RARPPGPALRRPRSAGRCPRLLGRAGRSPSGATPVCVYGAGGGCGASGPAPRARGAEPGSVPRRPLVVGIKSVRLDPGSQVIGAHGRPVSPRQGVCRGGGGVVRTPLTADARICYEERREGGASACDAPDEDWVVCGIA